MTSDEQTHRAHPQVTTDDLRMLLEAGRPDSRLALTRGRIELSGDGGDGMELIRRAELVGRRGDHPDQQELLEEAELLNTLIRMQGA